MTPSEFKAWFDGFTEAFTGCPTKAQWARVKERVAEIDGKPVTERFFVDRYWPTSPTVYPYRAYSGAAFGNICAGLVQNQAGNVGNTQSGSFSSHNAMADLGRAEANSLV